MWIYDNEIDSVAGGFENGDVVEVRDFDGYCMGKGFINTQSRITVRMLSRKKDTVIDEAFIRQRVRDAWEYRRETIDTSSCRVIFGEADFLPGIVVDKFSDVLVVESLALGIDRWKKVIVEALKEILAQDGIAVRGVYERSDAKVRLQEGMERSKDLSGRLLIPRWRSGRTASAIWWMWRTARRPVFSGPEKQPCRHPSSLQGEAGIGLLYPHGLFCPERRDRRGGQRAGGGRLPAGGGTGGGKRGVEWPAGPGEVPLRGCV